jgi:sugar phosphate isomerase/epimerase
MKLGLMSGDIVSSQERRFLGFEAVQLFFGMGDNAAANDPTADVVDQAIGDLSLAAMTLHIDLVGPHGVIATDVERAALCVEKTAALKDRFDNQNKPIMVWHPSGYPEASGVKDEVVFQGLVEALKTVCHTAEKHEVHVAVEITRAGSVGGAETFLRLKDHVGSDALRVCLDAANFVPDRTPLERAVRMLGPDTVIAHGKDASFSINGEVAEYGPTGSGALDYTTYIQCLLEYTQVPYFIFEYYKSREDLLRARDIVLSCMNA